METVFIGRNLIFLPEADSTNSYAIELLKNVKLEEGTLVYTDYQTHGKGQRGSSWKSESSSNCTLSVVLFPDFLKLQNQFYLYQIAALACNDTIAELLNSSQFDIKIKWPNDILVDHKKITGILIENNVMDNRINSCVIGIGMNVNQLVFEEGIKATSLKHCSAQHFDTVVVMRLICKHLERYYLLLKANQTDLIQYEYEKCLFGKEQWMNYEKENKLIQLKVKGLAKNGFLIMEDIEGTEIEVDVKEVKWLS